MIKTKIIAIDKVHLTNLTIFTGLLFIAINAPFFHFQPITGPIVNATLFVAVLLLGATEGIMIGLLPSLVALSVGTLPPPLAPMIPFIMVSNAILVVVFSYLQNKNLTFAVVTASITKYLFLLATSYFMVKLISQENMAIKATSIMMSYPQLLTALAGGIIAYFAIRAKNAIIIR